MIYVGARHMLITPATMFPLPKGPPLQRPLPCLRTNSTRHFTIASFAAYEPLRSAPERHMRHIEEFLPSRCRHVTTTHGARRRHARVVVMRHALLLYLHDVYYMTSGRRRWRQPEDGVAEAPQAEQSRTLHRVALLTRHAPWLPRYKYALPYAAA